MKESNRIAGIGAEPYGTYWNLTRRRWPVEPETNEDAEKDEATPANFCSACGEESDTLEKCAACKCVWYCGKNCRNGHRKEHTRKMEFRRIE